MIKWNRFDTDNKKMDELFSLTGLASQLLLIVSKSKWQYPGGGELTTLVYEGVHMFLKPKYNEHLLKTFYTSSEMI